MEQAGIFDDLVSQPLIKEIISAVSDGNHVIKTTSDEHAR